MKTVTFDVETTMKCPKGHAAHPMWPENKVVLWGTKEIGLNPVTGTDDTPLKDVGHVVGQNIKFDLLYALKHHYITSEQLAGMTIWDCQLAEYLLSGQQNMYASLDELVVRYGGTLKDSEVTEFFKAGKGADEIPMSLLQPYLEDDLRNTEEVYITQVGKSITYEMQQLIRSQMDALRATILMEWHGMKVDSEYIDGRIDSLEKELSETQRKIYEIIAASKLPLPPYWSYTSGKDLSLYLFGGTWNREGKEFIGTYKSGARAGEPKYKKVSSVVHVDGTYIPERVGAEKNARGYYTVDEKVLKNIGNSFTTLILKARGLHKQKTTYFEGLKDLTFPGDYIFPSLNHTATKTGRLSCTKPNIQNQTDEGGIKRAYISRWGEEGSLVEFDYSQLEMVALACISGDMRLREDISSGKDMHTELYKDMYGVVPLKEERKWFKRLSFGLVYGAGYKTLAENAGCSEVDAKKFIRVFYGRYPGVKAWHDLQIETAKRKRIVTKEHDPLPVGKYVQHTPTGRRYVYREYYNDYRKEMSFSPTELKNYPVQGFATGDIVPHMVGYIVHHLATSKLFGHRAVPIMTVHDSLLFDVHNSVLDNFVEKCYNALRNTTKEVNKHFGLSLPITLEVGCKIGPNWQDMTEKEFK